MASERPSHQLQVHPQPRYEGGSKFLGQGPQTSGPSPSKILAVVTMLPVGGTLLFLATITLFGTFVGLMLATPVFIICSPVLVPAAFAIGLAVTGFLGSGALGLTALSSLSWVFNYLRGAAGQMPEHLEQAKKRMHDVTGQVGQKTRDVGQTIQGKGQEVEQKSRT